MKLPLILFWCVSFFLVIILSCKKEYSCEGCIQSNKPPIAIAGNDTAIVSPINTIVLNGSASVDADGKIVSYKWSKLSGPGAIIIDNPDMANTSVKNLTKGVYQFELKVIDDRGLSARDTVEITVNDTIQSKYPPVANAGNDITANYDLQSCTIGTVTLNGSMSSDPDGTIVSYSWTQIPAPAFGPPPANILTPNSATTQVNGLLTGTYSFILKVTDNDLFTDNDTITITVVGNNRPLINAQLIPVGTLSQTRAGLTVGASGDKIVFAGGFDDNSNTSSRVDIYNTTNQSWQTASLSIPRYAIAAATLGNRIVFAGGYNGDEVSPLTYSNADVYDVTSNTWSVTSMSQAIGSRSAAVLNDKLYFGGGDHANGTIGNRDLPAVVDIYNPQTATWSTTALREGLFGLSACTANGKIYFAGGIMANGNATNEINIYDGNTWSVSTLVKARSDMACTAASNKIFWAGGLITSNGFVQNTTNHVEIKDVTTQTSTFACLSQPNAAFDAVVKNNQIIFFYR